MGVGVYSRDFDDFGSTFIIDPTESEDVQNDIHNVLQSVCDRFGSNDVFYGKDKYLKKDEDMTIVAEIEDLQIYMRDWQHDIIIGVAPVKHMRDLLEEANNGYVDKKIECIEQHGASYDQLINAFEDQVKAVKRDLIAHFQEINMEPRYKTDTYSASSYNDIEIVHPENEEERKQQQRLLQSCFPKFDEKNEFNAYERLLKEIGLPEYCYVINMDERGVFEADVRNIYNDETIFEIKNDNPDGTIDLVQDGFMKHKEDIEGLEKYLKSLNLIDESASLCTEEETENTISKNFGSDVDFDDFVEKYETLKEKLYGETAMSPSA